MTLWRADAPWALCGMQLGNAGSLVNIHAHTLWMRITLRPVNANTAQRSTAGQAASALAAFDAPAFV